MKKLLITIIPAILFAACNQHETNSNSKEGDIEAVSNNTNPGNLSDKDIADAYSYLLGRVLVLKQEHLDLTKEGFTWNKIIYRTPGGVQWANPNLDVAYSEAWIAVDSQTCVILEIPKIMGRYYTWHMLNGWGETILNINERTYPNQPYGKYALCLKGSHPTIPPGALRVDLPCKTSRVLARVELGNNMQQAVSLQKQFTITPQGDVKVDSLPKVPMFESMQFPGAEMFDNADELLASEADINEGMQPMQEKVKAVEAMVKSGADGKARVDKVIKEKAMPEIVGKLHNIGAEGNGWLHPLNAGNYKNDYLMRTAVNIAGIWANNLHEATYYAKVGLDGGKTYVLNFPKGELPGSKARYFWSVIAIDAIKYQVLPNPQKRYLLNKESGLKYNADSSLTLVFGPKPIRIYPASNWLPTIDGVKYNLTFRYYGASDDIVNGKYFLPELKEQ
jgi:hypothetical protein